MRLFSTWLPSVRCVVGVVGEEVTGLMQPLPRYEAPCAALWFSLPSRASRSYFLHLAPMVCRISFCSLRRPPVRFGAGTLLTLAAFRSLSRAPLLVRAPVP